MAPSEDRPLPFSEIPIGTILPWYGSTTTSCPKNYLFCDGSQFHSHQHPHLFDILVASNNPELRKDEFGNPLPSGVIKLPDLRGVFLRGFDPERKGRVDNDPDRKYVGHIQKDNMKKHHHYIDHVMYKPTGGGGIYKIGADTPYFLEGSVQTEGSRDDDSRPHGYETRPINANVAFIIRADI